MSEEIDERPAIEDFEDLVDTIDMYLYQDSRETAERVAAALWGRKGGVPTGAAECHWRDDLIERAQKLGEYLNQRAWPEVDIAVALRLAREVAQVTPGPRRGPRPTDSEEYSREQ